MVALISFIKTEQKMSLSTIIFQWQKTFWRDNIDIETVTDITDEKKDTKIYSDMKVSVSDNYQLVTNF